MKKLLLFIVGVLAVSAMAQEYTLVWNEDFTDGSLDLAVWNIEVNGDGGGNNEFF